MYYISSSPIGEAVIVQLEGDHMLSFAENPDNADWRAYQEWLAEGNTPEPWPLPDYESPIQ